MTSMTDLVERSNLHIKHDDDIVSSSERDEEKTSSSEHDGKDKKKKFRTLILSTNVNDYDTGEEQKQ